MGKYSFLILVLSIFVALVSPNQAQALDPKVEGCKFFCRAQNPLVPGGRDTGYDNCIVQTQVEGRCGSTKKSTAPTNIPVPTARPTDETVAGASTCQKDFDRLKSACEGSADEADSTCDESNNTALTNSSNSAKSAGANSTADIQNSCGGSGKVSDSAKSAMNDYKDNCSGAVTSCRSSCAELALFLADGKCTAAVGFTQKAADFYADAQNKRCEAHQSAINAAEKAISNYSDTSTASALCQAGALGAQSLAQANKENEQAAAQKTFCEANPAYPGCGSAASANCNDPSQANNRVCICSKNPAACAMTQSDSSSVSGSLADPGSRLPSTAGDPSIGGDMPNIPVIDQPKLTGSNDVQGIDGRQGSSASVGGGGSGGSNSPRAAGGGAGGIPDMPAAGGGTYGGGGGSGNRSGFGSGGSGGYAGAAGSKDGAKAGGQGPDLRQFLPGGAYDPNSRANAMGGKVGQDGITGPHTDNWKKIQNRFQVLKNSLEP